MAFELASGLPGLIVDAHSTVKQPRERLRTKFGQGTSETEKQRCEPP